MDYAIGASDGVRCKPYPDMVEAALRALDAEKKDAVFVGDSEVDVYKRQCSACGLHSRWQLCCLTDVAYPLRVIRCGVHGFAMKLLRFVTGCNRALLS